MSSHFKMKNLKILHMLCGKFSKKVIQVERIHGHIGTQKLTNKQKMKFPRQMKYYYVDVCICAYVYMCGCGCVLGRSGQGSGECYQICGQLKNPSVSKTIKQPPAHVKLLSDPSHVLVIFRSLTCK